MLGAKVIKKKGIVISGHTDNARDEKNSNHSEQKTIIGKFGILFLIVVVFVMCVVNVYWNIYKKIQTDISSKSSELKRILPETQDVKNVVNELLRLRYQLQHTSDNNDKRSFVYDNINYNEVVFEVERKINNQLKISRNKGKDNGKTSTTVDGFHIDIKPISYSNLVGLNNFLKKITARSQEPIYVSSKTIVVGFTTLYERSVYQMIEFIKHVFPGFLIVKHISVEPTTPTVKTMYYDLKFKHKHLTELTVNAIRCEIEFDWIVLSRNNNVS